MANVDALTLRHHLNLFASSSPAPRQTNSVTTEINVHTGIDLNINHPRAIEGSSNPIITGILRSGLKNLFATKHGRMIPTTPLNSPKK